MKQEPKLIDKITTDEVLDQAYRWICKSREKTSCNNSIWDLRFNWEEDKEKLKDALRNNRYHLSPLRRYSIDGQGIDCWEACDAVVLKAIAIVLAEILEVDIPLCCTHIKGHGGSKKAVLNVLAQLKDYKFVFKSDIKSFYQSIDHQILLTQLKKKISDKTVLRLIYEYCNRLVWINGEYSLIDRGISLGCPLSPLFGAWFLQEMDLALMQQNVYYTRFMDDWLVLARTRNHLRKAIKATERILSRLKLEKHPDKTFIGWIKKGFDFLGYRLSLQCIQLSEKSEERCKTKLFQLYEQGADKNRIGKYWQNWVRWGKGGRAYHEHRSILSNQMLKMGLEIIKLLSTKFFLTLDNLFDLISIVSFSCYKTYKGAKI